MTHSNLDEITYFIENRTKPFYPSEITFTVYYLYVKYGEDNYNFILSVS